MSYYLLLNKRGFTLIELILVIGILSVIFAISAPIYGNWQVAIQSDTAAIEIKTALELAKSRSRSGYYNSEHGVYFDINESGADSYTIYKGQNYALRDQGQDDLRVLSNCLNLSTSLPTNEINFSKGLGEQSATGTITIVNSATSQTQTLSINELGVITN